jgi:hypothetical protein
MEPQGPGGLHDRALCDRSGMFNSGRDGNTRHPSDFHEGDGPVVLVDSATGMPADYSDPLAMESP